MTDLSETKEINNIQQDRKTRSDSGYQYFLWITHKIKRGREVEIEKGSVKKIPTLLQLGRTVFVKSKNGFTNMKEGY